MAKTYDFKKVAVLVSFVPLVGFIDGDAVTVEMNDDDWELIVGADGEPTRSKKNNKSGRITVRLQASSLSNDYLDGLRKLDDLTGLGQIPIMIKDLFGTDLVVAAACWLVKPPAMTFGRSSSQREWIFESGSIDLSQGGNF
jgi:hypothetical protein